MKFHEPTEAAIVLSWLLVGLAAEWLLVAVLTL